MLLKPYLTVIIICKNEVAVLPKTIQAALQVTPNIIVVDTGSTDGTIALLNTLPVRVIATIWQGYGPTKNIGIQASTTPWVLCIDADEVIDETLKKNIQKIDYGNATLVYAFKYINYVGNQALHYGEWRSDWHVRLFNTQVTSWSNEVVHETLVHALPTTEVRLLGYIHHYTSASLAARKLKLNLYATLHAQQKVNKSNLYLGVKKRLSSVVNFVTNYFLKGGFLDGLLGLQLAVASAVYTYNKYAFAQRLKKQIK